MARRFLRGVADAVEQEQIGHVVCRAVCRPPRPPTRERRVRPRRSRAARAPLLLPQLRAVTTSAGPDRNSLHQPARSERAVAEPRCERRARRPLYSRTGCAGVSDSVWHIVRRLVAIHRRKADGLRSRCRRRRIGHPPLRSVLGNDVRSSLTAATRSGRTSTVRNRFGDRIAVDRQRCSSPRNRAMAVDRCRCRTAAFCSCTARRLVAARAGDTASWANAGVASSRRTRSGTDPSIDQRRALAVCSGRRVCRVPCHRGARERRTCIEAVRPATDGRQSSRCRARFEDSVALPCGRCGGWGGNVSVTPSASTPLRTPAGCTTPRVWPSEQ